MKKYKCILSIAVFFAAYVFSAQAKLNVVATLPDFASLAREVGGDKVDVTAMAKATEDPHFTVDPIIAKAIAQHIATAFAAVDPPNAAAYQANYKTFEAKINAKLQEWGAKLLPFKGQSLVAYHDSWVYF